MNDFFKALFIFQKAVLLKVNSYKINCFIIFSNVMKNIMRK